MGLSVASRELPLSIIDKEGLFWATTEKEHPMMIKEIKKLEKEITHLYDMSFLLNIESKLPPDKEIIFVPENDNGSDK